jgi:hypothetical protein
MTFELKGARYKRPGKKYACTVVDKHVTTNSAGDVVKVRYVSAHELMGQTVHEYDVLETTIMRNRIEE